MCQFGLSPLLWAVRSNYPKCAHELLERKADPNDVDNVSVGNDYSTG